MKALVGLLISVVLLFFVLTACEKAFEPDTPGNTARLAVKAISDGDYARFNTYFSEGREGKVSQDTFQEAGKLSTAGASY